MNPLIVEPANLDKCGNVLLAALWMTGNQSKWPGTPASEPCDPHLDPGMLNLLYEQGFIEKPPLVEHRPIRLTVAGRCRAIEAFKQLCCD